jgi:hypothetical protein
MIKTSADALMSAEADAIHVVPARGSNRPGCAVAWRRPVYLW